MWPISPTILFENSSIPKERKLVFYPGSSFLKPTLMRRSCLATSVSTTATKTTTTKQGQLFSDVVHWKVD